MQLLAYIVLIASILLGAGGQILLKKGMLRHPGFKLAGLLALIGSWEIIAGFGLYGISTLLYLKVLGSLNLSLAYPTISLGYVFVVIMSAILFKERVTHRRWAAITLICFGVMLVGVGAG